jgi:hypothetical protein
MYSNVQPICGINFNIIQNYVQEKIKNVCGKDKVCGNDTMVAKDKVCGNDTMVAKDKVVTVSVSILHLKTKSLRHRLLRMSSNDFIQIHPTVFTVIKYSYLMYQQHRTSEVVKVNQQCYTTNIGTR